MIKNEIIFLLVSSGAMFYGSESSSTIFLKRSDKAAQQALLRSPFAELYRSAQTGNYIKLSNIIETESPQRSFLLVAKVVAVGLVEIPGCDVGGEKYRQNCALILSEKIENFKK